MDKKQLLAYQLQQYPDSVILSHEKLAGFHRRHIAELIMDYKENHPDSVAYYLPAGRYGSLNDSCNGVRYGVDGDYLSLPHINTKL